MAFWKKSEDPWDIDPEKRKKQTTAAFWENDAPAETDPAGAQSGQAENEAPRGQSLGESIKGFFGGKKEDAPITRQGIKRLYERIDRAVTDSGCGIDFHSLNRRGRHTIATFMNNAALDEKTFAAWKTHPRLYKVGCYPTFEEKEEKMHSDMCEGNLYKWFCDVEVQKGDVVEYKVVTTYDDGTNSFLMEEGNGTVTVDKAEN